MCTPLCVSRERVDCGEQWDLLDRVPTHADSVDHTETESTPLEAVSHGEDRVGSLSRLRDENRDIVSEDGRSSVEEVGRWSQLAA